MFLLDYVYRWWYDYKPPMSTIKIMPTEKDRPPIKLLPGRRTLTPNELLEWYFQSEKTKLPPFPSEDI